MIPCTQSIPVSTGNSSDIKDVEHVSYQIVMFSECPVMNISCYDPSSSAKPNLDVIGMIGLNWLVLIQIVYKSVYIGQIQV